jgi:hypothetical protein
MREVVMVDEPQSLSTVFAGPAKPYFEMTEDEQRKFQADFLRRVGSKACDARNAQQTRHRQQ